MLKSKPTIEQLLERIDKLEQIIREKPRNASNTLSQMLEQSKMKSDKRTREVLARTFGGVSKARGDAMLRAIEEHRSLWK